MNLTHIENWLSAIPNPSTFGFSQEPTPSLPDATESKSYKATNLGIPQSHWAQMTTPPPSTPSNLGGRRRDASPTKRQRRDSPQTDAQYRDDSNLAADEDATPRSNPAARPVTLEHQPIPLRRMNNTPSLPPSQPSNASNGTPSVAASVPASELARSRARRPKSPVKSGNSLMVMEKPVYHELLEDDELDRLPPDVLPLFLSIQDITIEHKSFLPSEIKQHLKPLIPRAKDDWFHRPNDVSIPDSTCNALPSPADMALAELNTLREIKAEAKICQLSGDSELSWNISVHAPILRHALSTHPTVRVQPSMSAKIATPFAPPTGGRGGGSVIESKMIDFSLILWLNRGRPHCAPEDKVSEADARLIGAIAERVWAQPGDCQTVNQTMFPPLQFAPIACNIETKISTSSEDAQLQLSVWTAAWYERMRQLLPADGPMVSLPLINVVGHDWKISFASVKEERIEIIGEHLIGDTRTMQGLYTLIAALRRIADWITTTYREWAERAFLGDV
ncbi:hypothetical protein EDB80DRAFT_738227 [Ilyonectria destructans]|nr:hypothetical protein EDB80DRAFT_738227 [Ilyonectria destructans]